MLIKHDAIPINYNAQHSFTRALYLHADRHLVTALLAAQEGVSIGEIKHHRDPAVGLLNKGCLVVENRYAC